MMGHKVSLLSILLSITLLLSACGAKNEVIYSVEGSATEAEISYTDTEGETFTQTVSLPWQTSLTGGNDIDFQLSAQRTSDSGNISCAVIINEQSLASVEAKVFAECKGSFSRNGGTTRSNASTRIDPPSLLMPVVAEEIHAALEADALPSIEKDWALELYEQAIDCRSVDANLTKAEFSLQIPSGFAIETCEAEEVVSGYATFKDDLETPSFIVELPWFGHTKNKNNALGDGWELLDEHAADTVSAGKGIRIDNRSEIEHNGEYMPFLDMVQFGDVVVLSRLVLLLGKDGEGMGFYVEQELEGSATETYARLDALSREMISSAVIDSFSPHILVTWVASEINEDGSAKNPQLNYPEGTQDLYAVFSVEEFQPETTVTIELSKEDELVSQETITWGEREADGTFAFLLTEDLDLELGKYRFKYELSATNTSSSSLDTLSTSVTIGKSETDYVDEIFDLNEADNMEAALELSEEALMVYPNSADILNNRAVSLRREGRMEEAIEVLQKAIALAPEFVNPYYQLGVIYQEEDDTDNAFSYYTKGIDLGEEDNLTSAMHLRRGVIYYNQDDLLAATNDFEKAYQLNPNNTQALFNHALIAKDLEDFELAIEKFNLTLESWVDDIWVYRRRAESYEALGEKTLAIADYEKILSLTDNADHLDIARAGLERLGE